MSANTVTAIVHPARKFGGVLEVPGDKSISHRLAMLAGLAAGTSTIRNFLRCEDCLNTMRAMEALGARTFFSAEGELTVRGTGGKFLEPAGPLNLGNSGTGLRLLTGLLAGQPLAVELTGDESLRSRPMNRIKEPLEQMGASVELLGPKGCAPVRVRGGALKGIEYRLPVASAQVKSAVLLAGLFAEGPTAVIEAQATRDHTERLLRQLGVPVTVKGPRIEVPGYGPKSPPLPALDWAVPGDFSSAAFWITAVAAMPGAELTVRNIGLNPRRTGLLKVLKRMGANVEMVMRAAKPDEELVGDVTVRGAALHGTEVGGEEIPCLIDELPLVAVAGALADGRTVIRNAGELRVKETDRIAAMVSNLRLLGVAAAEQPDGLSVQGPARLKDAGGVRSHGDHRVAMAMAVLALFADGPVVIGNTACVETSYPGFWADLRRLGAHVES